MLGETRFQVKKITSMLLGFYQFKEFFDCCTFALCDFSISSLHDFNNGCRKDDLKNLMDLPSEVFSMSETFSNSDFKPAAFSSSKSSERLGTVVGSKSSQLLGSIGIQTRPVLGCTHYTEWSL